MTTVDVDIDILKAADTHSQYMVMHDITKTINTIANNMLVSDNKKNMSNNMQLLTDIYNKIEDSSKGKHILIKNYNDVHLGLIDNIKKYFFVDTFSGGKSEGFTIVAPRSDKNIYDIPVGKMMLAYGMKNRAKMSGGSKGKTKDELIAIDELMNDLNIKIIKPTVRNTTISGGTKKKGSKDKLDTQYSELKDIFHELSGGTKKTETEDDLNTQQSDLKDIFNEML